MALQGTVKGRDLCGVFRQVGGLGKTGTLFVKSGNSVGQVYFRGDRIFHARLRLKKDEEALEEILSLEGEFSWYEGLPSDNIPATLDLYPEEAIYRCYKKHARPAGETDPAKGLPPTDAPLAPTPRCDLVSGRLPLTEAERAVLAKARQGRTIHQLTAESPLPSRELLGVIDLLRTCGLLQASVPTPPGAPTPPTESPEMKRVWDSIEGLSG
ncbi:MAG: DUF4388 domain-containing protein [Nitrospirae bacterium]|nr:DUF4388 domain-containing protein [Nitrospirota bacterium]